MSLIDSIDEQHARLAIVKASEVELVDGTDAALKALGPPTDPLRMRATLAMLARADRQPEAAELVRELAPNDRWIDLATYLFSYLGEYDKAHSLMHRADQCPELHVMRRTRLGFAEGIIEKWQTRRNKDSLLSQHDWEPDIVDLAVEIINVLDPLLSLVRANRRIQGDLQLFAIQYGVYCSNIVGDEARLRELASWLVKHIPIPLMVAELALRRRIQCETSFPARLRTEHAGDFQAAYLAALLEHELLDQSQEAFDALVQLGDLAVTDDEKKMVSGAILETSGWCSPGRLDDAINAITQIRPDDTLLIGILRSFKHALGNDFDQAKRELDAVRVENDGVWWQAQAQLCERTGDEKSAQAAWEKASELLPHPEIIRRSVHAAFERRQFESAVRNLKKLLNESPNNERDLAHLASALTRLGDFSQAVEYWERLVDINPANPEYRMGLAQCLARTARVSSAVDVLLPVCEGDDVPTDATFLLSELFQADGRPEDGLRLLEPIAADHWNDPRFLLTYMNRAYAAGKDGLGSQALERLIELRGAGKVPSELMQAKTLEQVLEYGREYQERRKTLQSAVTSGRLPWLFVEDILGNPATWAWMLHTQELSWVSEEPLSRAAYSVYSTNGFTVHPSDDDKRLEPIQAAEKGTAVVVDLTALVTLHELGLLNAAAAFAGELILPSSYGDLRISDEGRFGQHQPSREQELQKIRSAVERGEIRVVEGEGIEGLTIVDEYHEGLGEERRLRDFIPILEATQRCSGEEIQELVRVAHKPSSTENAGRAFDVGARLLVDLSTLRTLAGQSVFAAILDLFDVHLQAEQQAELSAELQAHERVRSAKRSHDSLWETITQLHANGQVKWMPLPSVDEPDVEDDGRSVYPDAVKLSRDIGKPVVVDDRVLQVTVYQDQCAKVGDAFGSNHIILRMIESGDCSNDDAAACFRHLMNWRYRFLVPPSSLLLAWARQSKSEPPGGALLDVAAYLHDSLRDPGLHCGFEQSDPPMPIAGKLVAAWSDSIATFLANVWDDDTFSDDWASRLTRWVAEELIPSCPRGLWWHSVGVNIARVEAESTLNMAIVQFTSVREIRRANLGLRTLAQSLGLDDEEFITAAVGAINAVK